MAWGKTLAEAKGEIVESIIDVWLIVAIIRLSQELLDNLSFITYNVIMDIEIYQDANGNEPFQDWLDFIKDRRTLARIDNRLERVRAGNLGDHRSLGGGLYELRLQLGPGYRIYYGRVSEEFIVLLSGGDKSSQARDVAKAKQFWKDYIDYKRSQTP